MKTVITFDCKATITITIEYKSTMFNTYHTEMKIMLFFGYGT